MNKGTDGSKTPEDRNILQQKQRERVCENWKQLEHNWE